MRRSMSYSINMVMTVFGFLVSSIFLLYVLLRLICRRFRAQNISHNWALSAAMDSFTMRRSSCGLDTSAISHFPTIKYKDGLFASTEDAICTICLEAYEEKDGLRILSNCGHTFHILCIDSWLRLHPTCPVCRLNMQSRSRKSSCLLSHILQMYAHLCPSSPHVPPPSSSPPIGATLPRREEMTGFGLNPTAAATTTTATTTTTTNNVTNNANANTNDHEGGSSDHNEDCNLVEVRVRVRVGVSDGGCSHSKALDDACSSSHACIPIAFCHPPCPYPPYPPYKFSNIDSKQEGT